MAPHRSVLFLAGCFARITTEVMRRAARMVLRCLPQTNYLEDSGDVECCALGIPPLRTCLLTREGFSQLPASSFQLGRGVG